MNVLLVTALGCEARPVVESLRLQPAADGGEAFRLYRRGERWLVVSGVGKVAAAAATAWAAGRLAGEGTLALVNFGCAGHRGRSPGEVVLAHEVRDRASGRKWFPPLLFTPPCATSRVITVERPESRFADDACYEMEAAGFLESACRFTTAELAHCVKFVSDNTEQPAAALDGRRIGELAAAALEDLQAVLAEVEELAREVAEQREEPPAFAEVIERWHFTVTQGRQLRRLLERHQALEPGGGLPELGGCRSARQVLARLRQSVAAAALGVVEG